MGDHASVEHVLESAVRQLYADPAAAAAQAVDKIAAARVWLLKEKPFFGVLARALTVEPTLEVPAFKILADDRLRINPLVVLETKFPALCARVAHVAMHAALGALVRRGAREPLRWNAAHDLAIAPLLRAAGLGASAAPASVELPPGAAAEEYYLLLPEDARPDDLWCDLADPPPPPGPPAVAGQYTRQDDGTGDDDPGEGGGRRRHGSGESEVSDDGSDDAVPETSRVPESLDVDARARELQWKIRLAAALEEERASGGKTFGDMPAWIDEMVRATIEPPPDWSATLQRSVSLLTRTDRSFLRPSRRTSALLADDGSWPDVVAMPGRKVRPAGRLAAVLDTSASIASDTLSRFLGAMASVATAEGFDEIRLVQADAEVTRDETILAAELSFQPIAITGRGGSDFGPALRSLAAESRASGERFTVVYLTDLHGRFPRSEEVRPLEVLWVVAGKASEAPPFGRVIEMDLRRPRS